MARIGTNRRFSLGAMTALVSLLLLLSAELLGWYGVALWFLLPLAALPLYTERHWGIYALSAVLVAAIVFLLPLPHYVWFGYVCAFAPLPPLRMLADRYLRKGWLGSLFVFLLLNLSLGLGLLLLYVFSGAIPFSLLSPMHTVGVALLAELVLLFADIFFVLFRSFYQKKLHRKLLG